MLPAGVSGRLLAGPAPVAGGELRRQDPVCGRPDVLGHSEVLYSLYSKRITAYFPSAVPLLCGSCTVYLNTCSAAARVYIECTYLTFFILMYLSCCKYRLDQSALWAGAPAWSYRSSSMKLLSPTGKSSAFIVCKMFFLLKFCGSCKSYLLFLSCTRSCHKLRSYLLFFVVATKYVIQECLSPYPYLTSSCIVLICCRCRERALYAQVLKLRQRQHEIDEHTDQLYAVRKSSFCG